jgi:hypothetical protein
VWVQATAAMFDNREYPECPREFLARAVYPKVFEDCEGLRAQVGGTPLFHTPALKNPWAYASNAGCNTQTRSGGSPCSVGRLAGRRGVTGVSEMR